MKILIITGSGMKAGNTDQLSDAFMEGAKEAGHQVVKVFMGNMLIQGCIGCGACQKEIISVQLTDCMRSVKKINIRKGMWHY